MGDYIQTIIDAQTKAWAQARSQYHLTLGRLIAVLKAVDKDTLVYWRIMTYSPKDNCLVDKGGPDVDAGPHSYRGYYEDMAIQSTTKLPTAEEVLTMAEDALGETYHGYKGGRYTMGEDTPLWVSEYGKADGFAVVGARKVEDKLLLEIKHVGVG